VIEEWIDVHQSKCEAITSSARSNRERFAKDILVVRFFKQLEKRMIEYRASKADRSK